MLWLLSQMFVLCLVSFAAGSLLTWLSVRGRGKAEPPKPLLALPSPRLAAEKVVVEHTAEKAVAEPVRPESPLLKGNSRTMVYHTPESPYYKRMKGDMTFASEADALAAGYRMWTTKGRVKSAQPQ
ncbi:hypothetical protein SAMN05216188_106140 [Lentzea xinjiangensis]|uniref:Uncharacterized protein n=1 Tax=Lentzea xinjiangensis TaxID=402600 RepID=A0A1H9JTI9_9PSEU|nr:hypothetical protein [Lentzea xinjiangensis]SEQ90107.1 hypothetical protein SAMN05216188_106140 [Lentzea xinjiangensis]